MKVLLFTFIIAFTSSVHSETSSIIFIRHAEKSTGENPSLTQEGSRRASSLISLASVFDIAGIYSSNYKRTLETVGPLANYLNLNINSSISPVDYSGLKNDILRDFAGQVVLIVGHSNTIPGLINYFLSEQRVSMISEDDFSNLFILHYDDITNESELHRYKYSMTSHGLKLKPVSVTESKQE